MGGNTWGQYMEKKASGKPPVKNSCKICQIIVHSVIPVVYIIRFSQKGRPDRGQMKTRKGGWQWN